MINGIDKDVYHYVNQELNKIEKEFDDYIWMQNAIDNSLITEEEFIHFLNTPIKNTVGFGHFSEGYS